MKTMESLVSQTNSSPSPLSILQRIAETDKTAVKDCIDAYGSLVWALARKYTDSAEEAENATLEIFADIWKYVGRYNPIRFDEATFIFLITRRRLTKRLK